MAQAGEIERCGGLYGDVDWTAYSRHGLRVVG